MKTNEDIKKIRKVKDFGNFCQISNLVYLGPQSAAAFLLKDQSQNESDIALVKSLIGDVTVSKRSNKNRFFYDIL